MKNIILLTGYSGQLGFELARTLAPLGKILTPSSLELNLSQPEKINDYLEQHQPNIIVNAAAYTAVDAAEKNMDLAYAINETSPAIMANWCQKNNGLMMHYSTDYVFGDTQNYPYTETTEISPLNAYGASKAAGEVAVRRALKNHYIFRVSWLFSSTGNNFLRTIIRLAQERETLNIVNDQIGAPTSCSLVADVTALVLHRYLQGNDAHFGTYHLTAKGAISWYDFTQYIVQKLHSSRLDLALTIDNIKGIPSSEYPTPAKRPHYSCLNCQQLEKIFFLTLPDWTLGVDYVINQLNRSNAHPVK